MLEPLEKLKNQLYAQTVSCIDLVNLCLKNIDASKNLNIYIDIYKDEAIAKAKEIDLKIKNQSPLGKLAGCIVSIKDVICYENHPVTGASKILEGFVSTFSATAVQRLLDQDAIIIGRTNCDQFAMGSSNENSIYGPTLNGVDPSLVPGGSSGASAVSVQMNTCHIALGSDTGGSVRQPAAFCDLIGFKPGYGRISRYGLLAYASSFEQIGIIGRHIRDIQLVLDIMSGPDAFDATCSQVTIDENIATNKKSFFKIACFDSVFDHDGFDPIIKKQTKNYIDTLSAAGHQIEHIPFDYLEYLIPTYYILTTAEASSNLSRYDGVRYGWRPEGDFDSLDDLYIRTRSEGFSAVVKNRILMGTFVLSSGFHDAYFTKAQKVRRLIKENIDAIFEKYDFILMPTSPVFPWKLGEKSANPKEMYLADIFTVLANLTGIPAVSVPLKTNHDLPSGVQFFAPMNEEHKLFELISSEDVMR